MITHTYIYIDYYYYLLLFLWLLLLIYIYVCVCVRIILYYIIYINIIYTIFFNIIYIYIYHQNRSKSRFLMFRVLKPSSPSQRLRYRFLPIRPRSDTLQALLRGVQLRAQLLMLPAPFQCGRLWKMAVCQNLVPLVNIKIAGKWMFIPLKMLLIGIDPYPSLKQCWGSWKLFFKLIFGTRTCDVCLPSLKNSTFRLDTHVSLYAKHKHIS